MSMYDEMFEACRECQATVRDGEVKLTEAHFQRSGGGTYSDKELEKQASLGCSEGSGCGFARSKIVTRVEDGREVRYMVSQCNEDVNSVPPG